MTIKQQGGIFGRNPTFNDVTVDNELDLTNATIVGSPTFNDAQTIPSSLTITGENIDRLIKLDAVNKTINTATEWSSSGTTEFIQTMKARQSGNWRYVGFGQVGAELRFYNSNTNADVTTGEVFAINTGKSLIMSGGGNVVMNSGAGIDFSATSGTGTSELFDDYEEGVHTATMTPATSGTVTLNASYDELQYTKIGNMVSVRGQLITSSVSSPVGGYVAISLPFTSASGTGKRAGGAVHSYGIGSNVYATYPAHITENSSSLAVFLDASTLTASDQITLSFCYQAV